MTGPDGPDPGVTVEEITLSAGDLEVVVWTYGATLVEVVMPHRHGERRNVVCRLPDLAAYEDRRRNAYVGSTVGRYCRGVRDATFVLDGRRHVLDRNAGTHHLHGGRDGFDRRVWRARVEESADEVAAIMTLVSPDGDQGYPGEVTAEVAYRLDRQGRLAFHYRATTTAPTLVGLTNHAFWNLAGGGTVDDQLLTLHADHVVPFDEELFPLAGPARPVAGTALDFRRPRRIGAAPLDNFFVLPGPGLAAELTDERSGRRMRVSTDQPGLGVYSGDGLFTPRAGLALEAGAWPDAPNLPDAPSVRLDPGQIYRQRTVHEFSVEG
ncbi:galactose mutarotase [Plantactinospora mayteni]|uniref:Aldose 1-epimerase n=1 Tax=Plantactinospora mayteni TaxID=566021 RepID=A0ABQ4EID5_9ACTN|nr:aldose epimerase family protein [Plantactinospora mayteni]GIG94492.1 aldose 1-epimerase [Plantactinospora mayteni]